MRLQSDGLVGRRVLVVEGIGDLVGGVAELPLQDLLRACLTEGVFTVLEGETSSLTSGFGLLGTAKSSRTGLVFGPEQSDGMTLFRTDFPRVTRTDFPPGRALYATLGRSEVVQIAMPPADLARVGETSPLS
jgi:S-DNA-T family DNA segregation ATPase FtsK/SpoIIIE